MVTNIGVRLLGVFGAIGLWCGTAYAQSGTPSADDRDTVLQITPYIWAAGVGGSATPFPGGPTFESSKSFSDLLEDLDAAIFVTGLVRKDRFVAVADFSHTASSREGIVPTGNPAVPFVPAEGRLKQTSATLLAGVRAVDRPRISVDLLAGARAYWIDATVEVPAAGVSRSPGSDFIDPIVGTRLNLGLRDGWSLLLYGDLGGFGAGSEFTFQVAATVNARVASKIWLSGGYRHLSVDYRGEGLEVDIDLGGPLLGATFIF